MDQGTASLLESVGPKGESRRGESSPGCSWVRSSCLTSRQAPEDWLGQGEGLTIRQPGRTCVQILPLSSPSCVASNKQRDPLGFGSFSVK